MRRTWFDRLMHGDEDEYDEGAGEPSTPVAAALSPAMMPSPPPQPEPQPTPPMEEPLISREAPASAVRPLRSWAGADTVELLNELSPAARERIAEALQMWHDSEERLHTCAQHVRAVSDTVTDLTAAGFSTEEFQPALQTLLQSGGAQSQALDELLLMNRVRVHEWVLAALQNQRQWAPEKVIRLFHISGVGPLTLNDLVGRMRSMDAGPRAWAAEALGALEDPEAIPALLSLLRDPDSSVRVAAVASLGRKADPATLHALGQVIKRDPDWLVRLRAVRAAQEMCGFEVIGFLHELIRDGGWWRELQLLDGVNNSDASRPTPPKEMPAGTYAEVNRGVLETLLARIQDELPQAEPAHRAWLMEVLGDTKDARAVPLLTSALQDVEQEVRLKAISGLGHIGGPGVVDLLLPALRDQQSAVRIQAAEALGDANDFRAVEPLIETLRDSNEFVRAAVTVAIGKIVDTRALKPLLAALNDPDKEVRDQTQAAIQRMSDPRTMKVINGMLEAGGLRKPPIN